MLLGWITRRQYLEHHEPERWRVGANRPPAERDRDVTRDNLPVLIVAALDGNFGRWMPLRADPQCRLVRRPSRCNEGGARR